MTPRFAQAVDPVFLHVVGLLDRIQRGEQPSPQDERLRIRAMIDQAEATLGAGPDWEAAKYALVSWTDEVLVDAAWEGAEWWSNNVLEVEYFKTRLCFELFFTRAQEATTLARRDALEVYYVCVVLGFRGLYRDPQMAAQLTHSYGLPPDIDSWARQAAMSIRLGQRRGDLAAQRREINGAPPLRMRSLVLWSWWPALMLMAVSMVVFVLFASR